MGITNVDGILNFALPQEKTETMHSIRIISHNSDNDSEQSSCMPVIIPAAGSENSGEDRE